MNIQNQQRAEAILKQLQQKYPGKNSFDLDGRGLHFVCEVEPTQDHPEYDKAVEVIIDSKPHQHLKMTQYYTVLSGEMTLHVENQTLTLKAGDQYTIKPGSVHWAESDQCWVEILSRPGWTKEDHLVVSQ